MPSTLQPTVAASILQLQRVAPSQVQYLASTQIRAINQTNVVQCKVIWADIWHIARNLSVRLVRGHTKGFFAGSCRKLKPPPQPQRVTNRDIKDH